MTEHEKILKEALEAGKDPHIAWAAHCFGKKPEDVTPQERQQAKAESFALLYGTSFMSKVNWPQELKCLK